MYTSVTPIMLLLIIVVYKELTWGEPYAKWGESLVATGDAEAAKEKFAKALELEPKHPDFQKYRATSK